MNTDVKALILCNNPIAIPAIREFLFFGKVGAFVVTKRNKEMQQLLGSMVEGTGVPVIIVTKNNFIEKIKEAIDLYAVNVGLMMTFPFTLPEEVWKKPAKGFINFHFGLLPQCRGPQPILWHLLNNDEEAGITVHKVDGGIDTGEIIMQEKMRIETNDTYGLLQSKLAYLAGKPAANLLKILSYGSIVPSTPQDETKAAYYEMPAAKELTIQWQTMKAAEIIRLVNACNPWNKGAGTSTRQWVFGVTEVEDAGEYTDDELPAGSIISCNKQDGLLVKTIDNRKLKLSVVYTSEGFFSGSRLTDFGIREKDILG